MAAVHLVVIGSFNTDLAAHTGRMPVPGETLMGSDFRMGPGGKGANQAVAAARLGARTDFIGCVGTDPFGDLALQSLQRENVGTVYSRRDTLPTGAALILVDRNGENMIVVAPGANTSLSPADIDRARPLMAQAQVVLLQLEVPLETVAHAVRRGREAGAAVVLNPAPAQALPATLLADLDIITPNETEAQALTGTGDPEEAARRLRAQGVKAVVITLGAKGCYWEDPSGSGYVPAPPVERVVDTTGAGDSFNGALAVALGEGKSLPDACRFACKAAAIQVTRAGTAPAMPRRVEVDG